jgi:DivIVA domain-containing protein
MRSIFTRRGESPASFRISWRGYDRTEVDEFLRQTAADRQRLQEDLAQLEAIMATSGDERREMERLAAVRREVASCLETSIGALRTATGLLASVPPPTVLPTPRVHPHVIASPPQPRYVESRRDGRATLNASGLTTLNASGLAALNASLVNKVARFGALLDLSHKLPSWPIERRKPLLVGVASIAVLMVAGFMYQNQPRASEMPASQPAPEVQAAVPAAAVPAPAAEPAAAVTPAPAPAREDGLVLTLTARRACWIGSTLDGGQRLERLLASNETIMLRATNEAVLRIGDATALSVLINNQPTRPLGTTGEVVTHRITRANYKSLLEN